MQTFKEMIKLGDLPIEQKEQMSDAIKYSAEHDSEFYNEVNKVKLDANKTSMTFVRSYLPKIDKTSDRYKNGLVEGVTPDPEEINESEFTVAVKENGWYYKFTNKALNHAWTDIKARCVKFLKNLFNTYHDEQIADCYLSSANIVTKVNLLDYKDLSRLGTILYKNKAKDFNGFYKLVVPPEVADAMLYTYKDQLTHTSEKEAIIKGEVGRIARLVIIRSNLQAFELQGDGTAPFIVYGKTYNDEYPVSMCAYEDMADGIIYTPLGALGNDPLKQRGSIGLYVDGHGFYVLDDSACVTGKCTAVTSAISTVTSTFTDEDRSNLVKTNVAPSGIYPEVTYTEIKVAGEYTLVINDKDGSPLTVTEYNFVSTVPEIAKLDGTKTNKIIGVKQGFANIVVTKKDDATINTIVTVKVVK